MKRFKDPIFFWVNSPDVRPLEHHIVLCSRAKLGSSISWQPDSTELVIVRVQVWSFLFSGDRFYSSVLVVELANMHTLTHFLESILFSLITLVHTSSSKAFFFYFCSLFLFLHSPHFCSFASTSSPLHSTPSIAFSPSIWLLPSISEQARWLYFKICLKSCRLTVAQS